jgi:restriction endonuclease S subunit
MSPDYLKYYFNFLYNIRLNMLSIKQSTGLQNINIPNYLRNSFSYPPEKTEQQAIADYLDNKTSKIDSALAELTKQKSLLIELKKSTIHQAVTKGLDPTVPMKDSGHEWIGEIPEGWQVKNIKEYFKFSMGNIILKEDLNESKKGIPVYSATAEDKFFGYVNNANLILNKDDLVIPARGNSIGFVKIVKGISTATQTTIAAKSNKKRNSKFVYYYLTGLKSEIFKFDNTAIPQYTVETAKTIKTCIPKNEEQTEIVEYLDIKIGQINQSIKVIDNQITKMKKYKKTLINYVVTGKIKVID